MQDNKPSIAEDLERVGLSRLRTILSVNWKGHRYKFVPEMEITLDLDKSQRGAHMSRLVESITESVEEETAIVHESLEEVEKAILEKLSSKHPYRKAQVSMKTELVIKKKTPKTGKTTMETHDVFIRVSSDEGDYSKFLSVEVYGNTVCPHALNNLKGRTHIQRARVFLEIETAYDNKVELEDMIDCVERAFPSEVYTLLKTEDECYVVDKMFRQPKFVEDVTREALDNAKKKFPGCLIRVRSISEESIHRHDVIAEGSCRT